MWSLVAGLTLTVALTSFACGKSEEIPGPVRAIEEEAEDAIDSVILENWLEVESDARRIDEEWAKFLAADSSKDVTSEQKMAMTAAVANLRTAAGSHEDLDARQAANDVSRVIIEVFALFDPKIPTDISRLDYLERQVIIDTERGDWIAVESDLSEVGETFDRVRSDVETTGGTAEAESFAVSVAQQVKLAGGHDLAIIDEAILALEQVDELESVY